MAYTSLQLITGAYYLSGIVSQLFETVEADQVSIGLNALNEILDDKTVDDGMIPYTTKGNFVGVIGQEAYPIDNLISIDTLTYLKESVRYTLRPIARDKYFGNPRIENVNTLPTTYHLERNFGGATIYMHFSPDVAYQFEYWGKVRLNNVALAQDLSLTIDGFFRNYLKYALAERLCAINSADTPKAITLQLIKYRREIDERSSPMDLTIRKMSTLRNRCWGDIYQEANLGKGWYPS